MKARSIFVVLVGIVLASGLAVERVISQQLLPDDSGAPRNGLWRDIDGNYWCGGTCASGQKCCTITY